MAWIIRIESTYKFKPSRRSKSLDQSPRSNSMLFPEFFFFFSLIFNRADPMLAAKSARLSDYSPPTE